MKDKKYERYIDMLFDENNLDNITLKDNNGKEVEFEQVAIIDFEEKYYAILSPVTPIDGVGENEALVFRIDEERDELFYEEDDATINGVFDVYLETLEEDEED